MENISIDMVNENSVVKFINEDKTFFDGKVKKVDKNFLGIIINMNQSTYKEFKKNQSIQLIFMYKNEAMKCLATIIGSKIVEREQSVVIDIPKIVFKIERREYQRIDIVMGAEYSQLPEGTEYEKLSMVDPVFFRRFKKTYTIDISAGGVNIVTSIKDRDSKFVLIGISINDINITTLCSMVRSETMEDVNYKKMAYKFVDINKDHRQLILDYVNTMSKE
ncbi:MAG: PilZ domain-containing protein [Clostridiaceae bacterium]|nr:PilZ domain-containing protein [Clostridiaceae bacterium]